MKKEKTVWEQKKGTHRLLDEVLLGLGYINHAQLDKALAVQI
jgi:hypothetical protein